MVVSASVWLTRKYMWNKKSTENTPKNKKEVNSLHTWPSWKTRLQLKYSEKGLTISTAQAAVVRNAPVR